MTPEISVLLPYRDAADTIDEALDSVLGQAGVSLEVIAVDDGSHDEGPTKVAGWAARSRAVVRVAAGGSGIPGALNLGLRHARAPLIARMDADDVSLPGRLARERELLRADATVAVVGCRVEVFPPAIVGQGWARYVAWQNSIVTASDHRREIFVESPLCHPSVLMRRAPLELVGGWRDGHFPEDYDLWLRLDAAGHGLAKVPEVLFRWRHRPGRATETDPRYAAARFPIVKAPALAARLRTLDRPVIVWGAGPTGKRLARALEPEGLRPEAFVDIDPRKIGRAARGAPIRTPDDLTRGRHTVLVAVGSRGARQLIRTWLLEKGFQEGDDFLCAA